MSQTWSYTNTSCSRCMSQTCLTLVYISRLMHVPNMSYTSSCLNADAMSQTWSYKTLALIMWLMHVPNMSYTST
ncbi:hypothetical protein F383_16945 [Gossypium arboreum]|uniref:Uncharacterized protein n=1 Tax=Gossypium arboreum TaxID=29729 RepID=A0A0B0NRH1_GOSAR|nr:hypothetical protein F383_16945 [Gossypium arboreum]